MQDAVANYELEEYRLERDQLDMPTVHDETLA
jgi:hypothetical protein